MSSPCRLQASVQAGCPKHDHEGFCLECSQGLPLSGGMESVSYGSLPSSGAYMSDGGAVMDKHRRNGHMGHVLNNVEAQLLDLRCPPFAALCPGCR